MRRSSLWITAILMVVLSSCRYKDLCYDHNHESSENFYLKLSLKLDIDVDIEVSEEYHTEIKVPTYLVVCFYDTLTGAMRNMEYVGSYGGPLHVNPGTYDMVVYSFDTEWTQVRGEGNINDLVAFTSDISKLKSHMLALFDTKEDETPPGPIIYTPDHLLVTRKRVEIPPYSTEEQHITIEATAKTIAQTYSFQLRNIDGIQYVSSAEAFITNQARASYFGRGEISKEPATIYFPMGVNRKEKTLQCTFNTFGKLPGESRSFLNMVLTDTEGKPHTIVTDVTEQFQDTTHTIVINDSVVVPPPESGGGIAPTVEEWEEENVDVPIG